MKYTDLIINIDKDSGNITIAFPIDNEVQILAGFPIDDVASLEIALENYEAAYENGLQIEQVEIDPLLASKVK